MAIVKTDDKYYKDIADRIRGLSINSSSRNAQYKPSEMSDSVERLALEYASLGDKNGYERGKEEGIAQGIEQGKQAEYDAFWDAFQINGNKRYYNYAFAYEGWTDANYNPKYPIYCSNSSSAAGNNIFRSSLITDTKVPVTIEGNGQGAFYTCSMRIIRKLIVTENTSYSNMFYATPIEEITIEGVIGRTFECASSVLSVASAKSIISHLKNYMGTDNEYTYSVKLNAGVWAALETNGTAPNGMTWAEYVSSLGWLT